VNALPLIIYGAVVLALLFAELREDRRAQYLFKPLAALGFVLLALYFGALETRYGQIVLAGLVACAVGDVFLLARKSENLFMAGMAAFALGHLAYFGAFIPFEGSDFGMMNFVIDGGIILGGLSFLRWLKPKLPKNMIWPVGIYTMIILLMVLNAIDLPLSRPLVFAMMGAVMFAVSDMFVARDRFAKPNPKNALAITPLYFGAQALFALSTVSGGA
jgi:uncharacterized membrane protein YhhN